MSKTLEVFEQNNPGAVRDIERIAIDEFVRICGSEEWMPPSPFWAGYIPVIKLGILAKILNNAKNSEVKLFAASCRLRANQPDQDLWAELLGAGLIAHLGGKVDFVPEIKKRTPDLMISDPYHGYIDVEVVRSQQKNSHQQLRKLIALINETIGTQDDRNLHIYLSSSFSQADVDELLDAVIQVSVGAHIGKPDCWHVVAGDLEERDRFIGGRIGSDLPPRWWQDSPCFFASSTRIGGNSSPVTKVASQVPDADYMNPIRRKAERPQRTGDLPYIIALDAQSLPGADRRLPNQLATFFPIWSHVSAVIIFFGLFGVHYYGWMASMVENPYAVRPAKGDFLSKLGATRDTFLIKQIIGSDVEEIK